MPQDYRVIYTTDEKYTKFIIIMRCDNHFQLYGKLNARLGFPSGLRIHHAVNMTTYEKYMDKIKEILVQ